MSDTRQNVIDAFEQKYNTLPDYVIRAPGRVNLIGEHTDYNDGFVLPMTINRAVYIAMRPRDDRRVIIDALDFDTRISFVLDELPAARPADEHESLPADYVQGVAWALLGADYDVQGWEGVMHGDVPIGAGLSSSAALEMAVAQTFSAVSKIEWNPRVMAKLGQRVENEWIGVNSGIMDQMISAAGKEDYALMIDCRTLETELAPLPPRTRIAILDTGTRRGLAASEYNNRRQSCERAAEFFGVDALRDLNMAQFKERASDLDPVTRRRARHIITENARVLAAKDAMLAGDSDLVGKLMDESHISMRDDFEISSEALNAIVECAQEHPDCHGARMTGGGFAGCAVALVKYGAEAEFTAHVEACYRERTSHEPKIYITRATDGTKVISSRA
jgi:galactokinase